LKTENCKLYYLGFSHFLGIGPVKFSLLKKHFGSAKRAYLADKKELVKTIGVVLTEKFVDFRNKFDPVKKMEELKKKEIMVLAVDDEDYPESLRNISDPPICIYLRGSIPKFFNAVGTPNPKSVKDLVSSPSRKAKTPVFEVYDLGDPPLGGEVDGKTRCRAFSQNLVFSIVGTRNPTQYGIQVARKFSYELTEAGFTIVSGMAYGIDTIAHESCLEAGGKTIAVLGCGVDIIYPSSNRFLYERISHCGGAIISEFPPGQFVLKGLFIARNRIISALSRGVMIVEGAKDSGSLITARYAATQGKDVFAPPNPITSVMSAAPNLLIKQGAKLVTSVEDIMEEFDMKITPKKKEDIKKKLNEIERLIFEILEEKPILIDDLAIILKKPISQVLNTLSLMEINGLVEKNDENYYQIRLF